MNCNNLNNMLNCSEMSIAGLKYITLYPFGDIYDYEYTDDNLNLVTNYRQNSLGAKYKVYPQSNLIGNTSFTDVNLFTHTVNTIVPSLSEEKRGEFEKLINKELTIICEDRNGKCWIIGQDRPVKLTDYGFSTGGTDNMYNLTFSGTSKHQMREVVCGVEGCEFSVNGTEYRESLFIIENASTFDYTGLYEIQADDITLSYTPVPFEPLLWNSDPNVYQRDLNSLQALLGTYGNWIVDSFIYDSLLDIVLIRIISTDTTYPLLSIGGQLINSFITITLNLQIVAGVNQINNIVTVKDSMLNILYSGNLTDTITGGIYGNNLQGTVGNAFINMTNLYSSGETFTVSVDSFCPNVEFTWTQEGLRNCNVGSYTYGENGKTYSAKVRKLGGDKPFGRMQIYFDRMVLSLYPHWNDAHGDFNQLKTDILTLFAQYPTIAIDQSSIVITEDSSYWYITFESTINDAYFYILSWGETIGSASTSNATQIARGGITQSNIGILNSLVPSDSNITITDINTNVINGQYGNVPTTNTGIPIDTGVFNSYNLIDRIGIDLNDYAETDDFNIAYTSIDCPDSNFDTKIGQCFDSIDKSTSKRYYRFKLPMINLPDNVGNVFEFDTSFGIFTMFSSLDLNSYTGIDEFSYMMTQAPINIRTLNIQFSYVEQSWYFEFMVDEPYRLYNIYSQYLDESFMLEEEFIVYDYSILPIMHPNVNTLWNFPTIDSIDMPFYNFDKIQNVLIKDRRKEYKFGDFYNDTTTVFSLNLVMNNNKNDFYTISFHASFPTSTNDLQTYFVVSPTIATSFDLITDLGGSYNTVRYIRIRDEYGIDIIKAWDITTQSNTTINLIGYTVLHSVFGKYGKFKLLYPENEVHAVSNETYSVVCPNFEPINSTLWFQSNDINPNDLVFVDAGADTAATTTGSNVIELTGSNLGVLEEGHYFKFDGFENIYIITDITGLFITLNNKVKEPTGNLQIRIGKIVELYDRSSYGRSITQTTDDFKGTLKYNAINGYNSINMLESERYLVDTTTYPLPNPEQYSILTVIKQHPLSVEKTIYAHGNINSDPYINFKFDGTTDIICEALTTDSVYLDSVVNTVTGNYQLMYAYYKGEFGGDMEVRVSTDGSLTPNVGITTFFGDVEYPVEVIGGSTNGVSEDNGFRGEIIEFIQFQETTVLDRQKNEGYLAWKYDLQGSLPNNHPYKNQRP